MTVYNRLLTLLKRSKDYKAFEARIMSFPRWYLDGLQAWTKADLRLFWENHTKQKIEPNFIGGW